jgi:hypothetical protein
VPAKSDTSTQPPTSTTPETPTAPDQSTGLKDSDSVKELLAKAEKSRADYLSKKAELLKGLKGADAQGREQIRNQLRESREQFLAQQREIRADIRKTVQDLKSQLADHSDIVDHAKEQTKATTKARKDGSD